MNQKTRTAAFISILIIAFGLVIYSFLESEKKDSSTIITIRSATSETSEEESFSVASSAVLSSSSVTSGKIITTSAAAEYEPPLMININTASEDELMKLSGIGYVTADSIIAYRIENGGFSNIEEIINVDGIGESKFNQIKSFIFVENPVYPEPQTEPQTEKSEEEPLIEEPSETDEYLPEEPAPLTLEDCIPINLNKAETDELMLLPYVNQEIAENIISLREQIGIYSNVYELLLVEGLSAAQCSEIFEYITVENDID